MESGYVVASVEPENPRAERGGGVYPTEQRAGPAFLVGEDQICKERLEIAQNEAVRVGSIERRRARPHAFICSPLRGALSYRLP